MYNEPISIVRDQRTIKIARKHEIYSSDIERHFDHYFDAVTNNDGVVDYSAAAFHLVNDFGFMPIFFPGFAEPVKTTKQYLDFAGFKEDSVAIDLGAYSGLSSILFSLAGARVFAVEADPVNIFACTKNFESFVDHGGKEIPLIGKAIWRDNCGVHFSSEGNMGSFIGEGSGRGTGVQVPSITLFDLAESFSLEKIDFIKCDVEGAEAHIFFQQQFFDKYNPKIIIESHYSDGAMTTDKCIYALERFGYRVSVCEQDGADFPLLKAERS